MLKRFLAAITFLAVFLFAWYFQAIQPVANFDVPARDFEVKAGSGLDAVSTYLSQEKLIRSRTAFKITVVKLGLTNKIQAGFFKLSPNMNAGEIAEALTKAYVRQVRVTIPEGLRSEEINFILEKAFKNIPDKKYSSVEFTSLSKNKEGRLFPDTYDFALAATTSDVVNKLSNRFDDVINSLKIPATQLNNVVILASLLEREAANSTEMPLVAGVIAKRLENGWPLQIDATVQYALTSKSCKKIECNWWPKDLSSADIRFASPYNTYQNKGLPPTAISNPGKEALSAAADPVQTSAWFYLHDLNGKIHFADTIEQHNQNICTYLKKDCN